MDENCWCCRPVALGQPFVAEGVVGAPGDLRSKAQLVRLQRPPVVAHQPHPGNDGGVIQNRQVARTLAERGDSGG